MSINAAHRARPSHELGVPLAKSTVTEKMIAELRADQGLPLSHGTSACFSNQLEVYLVFIKNVQVLFYNQKAIS